jgi:GT2 family glycosyltransferase
MTAPTKEAPPLVSVVVVSYNGLKHLDGLLASLLDQDLPREQYEVFVVDNASHDGSADFVEQCYPSVRVMRLDRNYGPGVAVDRALPHLRGRYLGYLNQDVVVNRRWLSELLKVMVSHPGARIVESNMILPQWPEFEGQRRDGFIRRAYVCDLTAMGVYDFNMVSVTSDSPPIPVLAVCGAGFLMDPQVQEAVGYLADPGFKAHADDMDLGLRVNAAGYEILLAPQSIVYHDTEWHFHWNLRNLRRSFWVTQNTILAFYKVSYTSEFVRILPRLVLGKVLKAGQHCRNPLARLAYRLMATPIALIGLAAALLKLPRFRERRRVTLEHRKQKPGWLLDRLLAATWTPDPAVWQGFRTPHPQQRPTAESELWMEA